MNYDIIGGDEIYEDIQFFSIGDLIRVLNAYAAFPVKFVGTNYTVGYLGSWRGSYDLPAITYEICNNKPAKQIAQELTQALKETHWGYKGGEYKYTEEDEFYISEHGAAEEYKVVKADVEDGFLVLYTKKDPY